MLDHSIKEKPARVRLEDLARAAKVSVSTVSLALRDDPAISPDTRKRIALLRNELGYVPLRQGAASAQAARRQFHFVLMERSFETDPYSLILDGVLAGCKAQRCDLSMSVSQKPIWEGGEIFPNDRELPMGVILAGAVSEQAIEDCEKRGIPFVVAGYHRFSRAVHSVQVDLAAIASLTIERAIKENGHRFAYVARDLKTHVSRQFLMHLRIALEQHRMDLPDIDVYIDGFDESLFLKNVERLLTRKPKIDIIFTDHSDYADIIRATLLRETDPPTVYSVASSGLEADPRPYPSVAIDFKRVGRIAVDRLCQLLSKDETAPDAYTCLLPPIGWLEPFSGGGA